MKNNKQNVDINKIKEYPLYVNKFGKKYSGNKEYSVKDVDFKVEKGEFHGFIGANGAGKTTTIKSLIGAYARFDGDVYVYGHKSDTVAAKKNIGYIPEAAKFPSELTAHEYIWKMAYLSGYTKKEAMEFATKQLKSLGMTKFANKNPNTFSSGQKKKILLAQALAHKPDLIIMDEPAANLDPKARNDFFMTLKKLQNEGKSIFMSSHILMELQEFVDAVTILDKGKVVYTGKITDLNKGTKLRYEFKFKTDDDTNKFTKWLKNQGLTIDKNDSKLVTVFKSDEQINKSLSYIVKEKMKLELFSSTTKTLQDIYNRFVGGANNV